MLVGNVGREGSREADSAEYRVGRLQRHVMRDDVSQAAVLLLGPRVGHSSDGTRGAPSDKVVGLRWRRVAQLSQRSA